MRMNVQVQMREIDIDSAFWPMSMRVQKSSFKYEELSRVMKEVLW